MKQKKAAALILAAAVMLSGCGANPAGDTNDSTGNTKDTAGASTGSGEETSGSQAGEVDTSERLTYSVFAQADDVPNPEEKLKTSPVINYWQDMFNIEMEWQLPPQGSEQDQYTLMLGTGDYTDIIDVSFSQDNLSTLCEDGAIWDLTPYIETCMPNYKAFLDANPDVKSALYNDEGHIYVAATIQDDPAQWGGLVYRRDILDAMTGGNIQFPSGNDEPTTIEDWEYMLDLMVQYFQSAGIAEYAGIILPACGYFATGELMAGFGIGGLDYIDENGNASYGIASDNFYNYLVKMKEWYEKGYIYADFASRSQDLFYLPNTALTYGGSAGIWYGISQQLEGSMSLPDYGLFMDVKPLIAPTDTENGIAKPLGIYLDAGRATEHSGWAVSTACPEDKLTRILTAFDWFYTDEGAATRSMGLSSEQGAGSYDQYNEAGCPNGARISGTIEWTEEMSNAADLGVYEFSQNRMPGIVVAYEPRNCDLNENGVDLTTVGDIGWTKYGNSNVYPLTVSFTPDESESTNNIQTDMLSYADTKIVSFIMGTEELTPESFKEYQQKLEALGLHDYLSIKQNAYDRYLDRAN